MAKKKGKHKRGSRWLSQAGLQALVRFGPEESGLKAAERTAVGTYASTVAGAEATRKGITKAIAYARPKVQKSYDDAGLQFARARDVAAPAIGAGPASTQAAVAAEQAGFTARLGESEANTLTEFDQRRVDAVSGAAYARKGARETLASDLAKLFERKQDIAREKGAFTVATAGELRRAAQQRADTLANQEAGRAVTRRGQDLSHADRVAARKNAAGGKKGPTRGGATKEALSNAGDEIDRLTGEVGNLYQRDDLTGELPSRREIRDVLMMGAKAQDRPVYKEDARTGKQVKVLNPDGTPKMKTIPGLDKAKSKLLLDVALDVAIGGHVSPANHRKLLSRGLSVRDLGLPSYGEWKRKGARRPRKPPTSGNAGPLLNPFG